MAANRKRKPKVQIEASSDEEAPRQRRPVSDDARAPTAAARGAIIPAPPPPIPSRAVNSAPQVPTPSRTRAAPAQPTPSTQAARGRAQPTQRSNALTVFPRSPADAETISEPAQLTQYSRRQAVAEEELRRSISVPLPKTARPGEDGRPATSPFVIAAQMQRRKTERVINADFGPINDMHRVVRNLNVILMKQRKPAPPPPLPELKLSDVVTLTPRIIKIISLLIIFSILSAQFVSNRVANYAPRLVSILPFGGKLFPVPNYTDTVSVTMNGPFLDDAEVLYTGYDDPTAYVISITVLRVFYNQDMFPITIAQVSDSWKDFIVATHHFESAKNVDRYIIIDLWQNISHDEYTAMYLKIDTNFNEAFTLKACYDWYPVDTFFGLFLGSIVLILMYVMFIWELASNTFTSILCSTLAVAFISMLNPPPLFDDIIGWIDMPMLMLLFCMMIIVDVMSEAGAFDFITVYAYQLSKGKIWHLIQILCIFISLLSACMNSSTTMLLATPIIVKLCEVSSLNPVRVLTCMVIFANIGAALTPIGSTANVIITTDKYIFEHGIHFGNFTLHTLPCVILVLFTTYWQLRLYYSDQTTLKYVETLSDDKDVENRRVKRWTRAGSGIGHVTRDENIMHSLMGRMASMLQGGLSDGLGSTDVPKETFETTLRDLKEHHGIRDKVLLIESLIAFIFVVTIFCLRSFENLHLIGFHWAALLGAVLLLVLAGDFGDFEAMMCRLDWATLIFLSSLFVLVEVLAKMGFADMLSTIAHGVITHVNESYQLLVAMMLVLWMTALASCVLNNNPVTTMMLRIVISLSQNTDLNLPLHPLVWALVLGACFGGNGTVIAASANIVTAGVAEKHCYKLNFRSYFFVGFTIMLVNIMVASIYLIIMHVLFQWHDMPTHLHRKQKHN